MSVQVVKVQADNRVFIDMADDPANPCLACGACCQSFRVSFYQGELASVGGSVPDALATQMPPFRACMQGTETGGRCVALRGTPGQPGIGCAIYANRPSVCREHEVWDPDGRPNPRCQQVRQKIGLPLLRHQELLDA